MGGGEGLEGELIVFSASDMPKTEQVKLSKKLYGYRDRSQRSKYLYEREGALNRIPHIIPLGRKAILVTRTGDAQPIIQLLRQHGAQTYVRTVKLEEEDLKALARDLDHGEDPGRGAGEGVGVGVGEGVLGEESQAQEDQ